MARRAAGREGGGDGGSARTKSAVIDLANNRLRLILQVGVE